MPAQPVEYHPFQYPRKYRPLGYGSWEPPAPPPPEPVHPRRRRRTVILVLAALLATIVIHVGIAAAYDRGGNGSTQLDASALEDAAAGPEQCDAEDAFADPSFQDGGTDQDSSSSGTGAPGADADPSFQQRL